MLRGLRLRSNVHHCLIVAPQGMIVRVLMAMDTVLPRDTGAGIGIGNGVSVTAGCMMGGDCVGSDDVPSG